MPNTSTLAAKVTRRSAGQAPEHKLVENPERILTSIKHHQTDIEIETETEATDSALDFPVPE